MSDFVMFDEAQATLYPTLWGQLQNLTGAAQGEPIRLAADAENEGRIALSMGDDWFVLEPEAARELLEQLQDALGVKPQPVVAPIMPPLQTYPGTPNPYAPIVPGRRFWSVGVSDGTGMSQGLAVQHSAQSGHYRCEVGGELPGDS